MNTELTTIEKSRKLRLKAKATEAMPHTSQRMAEMLTTRRESLDLNLSFEMELQAVQHELAMLTSQIYELVETSLRDTTGFEWMKAFKDKSKAHKHFQALHAIARYMKLRSHRD